MEPTSTTYLGLLPAGEVDVVAEEVGHALLRHLTLQRLQQVCKPLKGLRLWAQPVEVDLRGKHTVTTPVTTFTVKQTGIIRGCRLAGALC